MPPKQNPTLYSIKKTFIWFAIVSIVLTGCLAGIVYIDYKRDWKDYQKKFVQMKIQKTKEELNTAAGSIDKAELAKLQAELKEAQASAGSNKAEAARLEKEIAALATPIVKAKDNYQTLKQFFDSDRYYFEEYTKHKDPRAARYAKKMAELEPKVTAAKNEQERLEKERAVREARLAEFSARQKEVQRAIDKLLFDQKRLETRIEKIKPTLATDILNAPMLDFVAPTLKVQQIVLDNLQDDYHFAKVQKVDRCTTCHLGIDQKGFEDAPQPFRTHPDLDLYLGSASKHPIEKVGCTVCHGGNGHSVDFTLAAHTPKDEAQASAWAKKYHWHELEKWEHKMLPAGMTQAACAKCHTGVVEVPRADKLNEGRKIAQEMGCMNCHKINGFEDRWMVGPDLRHVHTKVSEEWVAKWLEDPKSFRASTKMPSVFHLSNTSTPEDRQKNHASIRAIAAYLTKNSEPVELLPVPAGGDATNGEKLVKTLGCLGCHSAAGIDTVNYGPELSGLGSKTSAEWIYTWVKNPKSISPETRMPDLRLSDKEAADITAYLMSQRNEEFEKIAPQTVDPSVTDELILTNLRGTMTDGEAKAELGKMSDDQKMEYLGKKAILHQGCFTCHSIKGFEDASRIGTDLSNEGSKDIHQFDFGFADIPHTRHDFIRQKLKDPRIFDHGKVKGYYEKLRMPQFSFTDAEIDALTVFLLSLTEEQIPLEMQKRLTSEEIHIEKGRLLVAQMNCMGCHTMAGHEGTIRALTEDPGQMPPVLDGEGAKVQEKWLHDFLHHPTPIRPWITYRMPTFGFDDEQLTTLVKYFDYLSGQDIPVAGVVIPPTTPAEMAAGKQLFDMFQCIKCHQISQESAAMGSSFLAPDLVMTKTRLKPDWVHAWMEDPQKIQEGTMMPTFFADGQSPAPDILEGDAQKQIKAIRDYLFRYEAGPSESQAQ